MKDKPKAAKPAGKAKAKSAPKGAPAAGCAASSIPEVLRELLGSAGKRLEEYSKAASTLGDVLKFLLGKVKNAKSQYDMLNRLNVVDARKFDLYDKESVRKFVDHLAKSLDEAGAKGCRNECSCNADGGQLFDATDTQLIQMLFAESKYAIDPGEMRAIRYPHLDTDEGIAFRFVANASAVGEGVRFDCQESFILRLTSCLAKSVEAFDRCVSSFCGIRFLTKQQKALRDKYAGKSDGKACPDGKQDEKPEKKAGKPEKKAGKVFPILKDLKKTVLECSKYAVPSSRVRFVYDHEDKKHGNHVYELRFYQKSYKNGKPSELSYEPARLVVRSAGDRDDLIAKRFDKAVAGLKFNQFKTK